MELGAFVVVLIMCSEVAIGHRSISRDIKYWQERERNSANLDTPIKGSGWGIKDPIDIDSNSFDSYEPDNSEHDSREQGGYHVGHHGGYHSHHGHHGRKNNDRTTAKPKRRPTTKTLYKNTPASTFMSTPMSKLLLKPVPAEKTNPKATSDSPRRTTSTTTKTIGNNTSTPDLIVWLKNESTGPNSIPKDSVTSSPFLDIPTCIRNCAASPEYNPVCGSNNVTYNNSEQLICARLCGVEVAFWQQTSCANKDASVTSTDPTPAPTNEWAKNIAVTASPKITQCIRKCYTPANYDPVCGTDGVTYSNSGYLLCAQFCGLDVKLKKTVACSNDGDQTIPLPTPIQLCVNNCPTSPLNSPVCGSNGITYKNTMQLVCHRVCGVDVQDVPCTTHTNGGNMNNPVSPSTVKNASTHYTAVDCIKVCPETLDYNPVCGTNNVTYRNLVQLGCARICGVTVEVKSKSPCESSAITIDSPNKSSTIAISGNKEDNGSTESYQGGFTIPPDVLATIFDSLTTTESNDFEIDPRFQN